MKLKLHFEGAFNILDPFIISKLLKPIILENLNYQN